MPASDGGDQRQAGTLSDEAATDTSSAAGTSSPTTTSVATKSINDDTVLEDLLDDNQGGKTSMMLEWTSLPSVVARTWMRRYRARAKL